MLVQGLSGFSPLQTQALPAFGKRNKVTANNFRPFHLCILMGKQASHSHVQLIEKGLSVFKVPSLFKLYKDGYRIIACTNLREYLKLDLTRREKRASNRIKMVNLNKKVNGREGVLDVDYKNIVIPQNIILRDRSHQQYNEYPIDAIDVIDSTLEEVLHAWEYKNKLSQEKWFRHAYRQDIVKGKSPECLEEYTYKDGSFSNEIMLEEAFVKVGKALIFERCPGLLGKAFIASESGKEFLRHTLAPLTELKHCARAFRVKVLPALLKPQHQGYPVLKHYRKWKQSDTEVDKTTAA